jgi:hypothetical protein
MREGDRERKGEEERRRRGEKATASSSPSLLFSFSLLSSAILRMDPENPDVRRNPLNRQ